MSENTPSSENEEDLKPIPPKEELTLGNEQAKKKEDAEEENDDELPLMPSNPELRTGLGQYDNF
ncbi:MAG: hypothetical protein ABI615_07715 [Chthoniobacterales bacterium]